MWRNDTKCRYMFMFPLKKLARKRLKLIQLSKRGSVYHELCMIWGICCNLIICLQGFIKQRWSWNNHIPCIPVSAGVLIVPFSWIVCKVFGTYSIAMCMIRCCFIQNQTRCIHSSAMLILVTYEADHIFHSWQLCLHSRHPIKPTWTSYPWCSTWYDKLKDKRW